MQDTLIFRELGHSGNLYSFFNDTSTTMNLAVALLLYMGSVLPNHTYTQSYVDNQILVNSVQINSIVQDPAQMAVVVDVYGPETELVHIEYAGD